MLGFMFLAISIGSFQLMLDRGQQLDWFDSIEIISRPWWRASPSRCS